MLQAFEKVKSWGEDAIYLYPAEKSLFAYYKRLGYRAGITCAAPTENSFWWDLDEPIREFFSATQEGSAARGECLWIPVREDNALAKSMLNNVAYTYLVGN